MRSTSNNARTQVSGAATEVSLAEHYRRHSSLVFGVAVRLTGDRRAAEEVTQAVFLDLWRRPERFDPTRGSLATWLATLAHHRSVDLLRQEAARKRREAKDPTGIDRWPGVEETVAATLAAERVRRALDDLSEPERTAIILAFYGGRSYRQVASELGVAEGTIKSRIRSGLQRLARALHEQADPAD